MACIRQKREAAAGLVQVGNEIEQGGQQRDQGDDKGEAAQRRQPSVVETIDQGSQNKGAGTDAGEEDVLDNGQSPVDMGTWADEFDDFCFH